jgi:hypothetical protein
MVGSMSPLSHATFRGLGFRVERFGHVRWGAWTRNLRNVDFEFGVVGSMCGGQGLMLGVKGAGLIGDGQGFGVTGLGHNMKGTGYRAQDSVYG